LENSDFGVLDLALARIVNGGDCGPLFGILEAVT
jgi:hypothetical protein